MNDAVHRDGRGGPIVLGDRLGEGGEGAVFTVRGRPDLCAKIHRPDLAASRAPKIAAMLARRPPWLVRRAVAWPIEPLFAGDPPTFAGFLMPMWRGAIELYALIVPDERMRVAGWLTARDAYTIAARLAGLVAGVHRAGHRVGDLKPQNVLVLPRSGRVVLVDADSFHVHDPRARVTYGASVLTPEYAAPELWRSGDGAIERTAASDAFALGVLIHQLLLGGAHPFDGDLAGGARSASTARIPERIRHGLCPFVPGAPIRPAPGALPFTVVPEPLRALFERCFGDGHASPGARPSASAWQQALLECRASLVRCPTSDGHWYPEGADECPYCARRERLGIDIYPPGQRWQRAIARTSSPAEAPEATRIAWLRRHVQGRMVEGRLTAAERAWLDKAGAALGFDRARVAQAVGDEERWSRSWLTRARDRVMASPRLARGREGIRRVLGRLARVRPSWRSPRGVWTASVARLRPKLAAALVFAVSVAAGTVCAAVVLARSNGDGRASVAPTVPGELVAPPVASALAVACASVGHTGGQGVYLRVAPRAEGGKVVVVDGTVVCPTGRAQAMGHVAWSEVNAPSLGRTGWIAARYVVPVARGDEAPAR